MVVVAMSEDEDEAAYRRFIEKSGINFVTVRTRASESNTFMGRFRFLRRTSLTAKAF